MTELSVLSLLNTTWPFTVMALLLPSLQGGLSATKSAPTFNCVIETEVVYAALSLQRKWLFILALLPAGWNQTCYAKFQKEGRTKLKEQESWHWNTTISPRFPLYRERNTVDKQATVIRRCVDPQPASLLFNMGMFAFCWLLWEPGPPVN